MERILLIFPTSGPHDMRDCRSVSCLRRHEQFWSTGGPVSKQQFSRLQCGEDTPVVSRSWSIQLERFRLRISEYKQVCNMDAIGLGSIIPCEDFVRAGGLEIFIFLGCGVPVDRGVSCVHLFLKVTSLCRGGRQAASTTRSSD